MNVTKEEKEHKFDDMIPAKCKCCDENKMESALHVIQCQSREKINEKNRKKFVEIMRKTEMPKDILKLLELGINLVIAGGETYRGDDWDTTYNTLCSTDHYTRGRFTCS